MSGLTPGRVENKILGAGSLTPEAGASRQAWHDAPKPLSNY
jgi:hypothetical protein